MEALMQEQASAVEADEILMQYYYEDGKGITYPDNFAGCYIENNTLYVCFTELDGDEEQLYDSLFGAYRLSVEFRYVEYSYNELFGYVKALAEKIEENGIVVTCYYVSVASNSIVLEAFEKDLCAVDEYVVEYKKKYGITVEVNPGSYTTTDTTLDGGTGITNGTVSFSLGLCGTYSQYPAFVTCGHGGIAVDDTISISSGGSQVGNVEFVRYANGQYGDFSIVSVTGGYSVSHKIGNTLRGITVITQGTVSNPAVGTIVGKYGNTSGYAYGEITATGVTLNADGNITIYGITEVELTSGSTASGDSGGP